MTFDLEDPLGARARLDAATELYSAPNFYTPIPMASAVGTHAGNGTTKEKTMPDKRIVILQRGWVAVGDYAKTGSEVTLSNASVIRRWGTTKGLGEIAANGPTENTVLDPTPTVRVHELAIVATIDCTAEKWPANAE